MIKKIPIIIGGVIQDEGNLRELILTNDTKVSISIVDDNHIKSIIDNDVINNLRLNQVVNFLYTVGSDGEVKNILVDGHIFEI